MVQNLKKKGAEIEELEDGMIIKGNTKLNGGKIYQIKHNKIDMTFNYHISVLKSPVPFKLGVDIYGSMEKMKFKITKAKYKNLFIPSKRAKVDSAQINVRNQIRQMLQAAKK